MSSRNSRFWSLWWRFGGSAARRNLAAGDVAAAHARYLDTVTEWLNAQNDWKQWEIAAVYSREEHLAGRHLGERLGHRGPEICFDLDRLEVPADTSGLLAEMDAAFADLCAAHEVLAALDPAVTAPVRHDHHVIAAARAAETS